VTDVDSSFPTLSQSELSVLEPLGTRRRVQPGDYLYRAGDVGYDFYVVLSGRVDITINTDGQERLLTTYGPGGFLGEINLLTGLRVFVDARVTEPGEVLAIPVEALRRIIATQPQLSDKILATFMSRRAVLMTGAASTTRVIGSRYSPETTQIREYLVRTTVPYQWFDTEADPEIDTILQQFDIQPGELPVVVSSGVVLRRPTPGALAEFLGSTIGDLPERYFDLVIVGGGPAGLAAAVYGASEGLRTLGVEMVAPGGQAGTTSRIENYFGFPTAISGADLTRRGIIQAEKFGAVLTVPCTANSLRDESGHLVVELSDGTTVTGRAVIAATGARYRRLDVDRLPEFESSSVYYAATDFEARQCGDRPAVVVGGGNSAGQAAVYLADQGSPVTVVIRGPDLDASMSHYLVDRLENHPGIEVRTESTIVALRGEASLEAVLIDGPSGTTTLPTSALFSFIGAEPASEWLSGCTAMDSRGFVLTDRALPDDQLDQRWTALHRRPLPFETSHPGLFAVGDLRSGSTKRVAAAVGEGSAAVKSVHEHLAFVAR
jgi:thioredoxin reductase (NADPH)